MTAVQHPLFGFFVNLSRGAARLSKAVCKARAAWQLLQMIITHAINAKGQRRVYLGGKSSLECWIAPKSDGVTWSFHVEPAVTGNPVSSEEKRQWALRTLVALADTLEIPAAALGDVSFDQIAALHMTNPFDCRRVALPRNKSIENGFMATVPGKTRVATGEKLKLRAM